MNEEIQRNLKAILLLASFEPHEPYSEAYLGSLLGKIHFLAYNIHIAFEEQYKKETVH